MESLNKIWSHIDHQLLYSTNVNLGLCFKLRDQAWVWSRIQDQILIQILDRINE
jgi:hypothetical protein